ncbi:MAG: LptF/LptG family permease [Candidatus Rhabdochlamydia sp.]
MPILWRFLLKTYFQTFCLCITSFIAAVFVMRFKDIAQFAAISADSTSVILFGLYQLPYILPLTIPIASVIAATLLFQKLSDDHELSALRACGFGLRHLLTPVLLGALILCLITFVTVAELAPRSRVWSKKLTYEVTSRNPFAILSQMTETKLTNTFIDIGSMRGGKEAKDVICVLNPPSSATLCIITAKQLHLSQDQLIGKQVSMISTAQTGYEEGFDHLMIENQAKMATKADAFSHLFQDQEKSYKPEYLPFKQLLIGISLEQDAPWTNRYTLEVMRRVSIALSPVVFSLLGASFGIRVGRSLSQTKVVWIIVLVALYLAAFVGAKNLKQLPLASWLCYTVPSSLLIFCSLKSLRHISQGDV